MTSKWRGGAVAAAATMLIACSSPSAQTSGPTTSVVSGSPGATHTPYQQLGEGPAVLEDGRHPVFMTDVDLSQRSITFDLTLFLTGAAAKAEWTKRHPDQPEGPPNDYLIVNDNPLLRTLRVSSDVVVKVVKPTAADPVALVGATLADLSIAQYAGHLFWITVSKEVITLIEEQFLP